MRAKDLTSLRFGSLTVIEFFGHQIQPCGATRRFWLCKCDCGKFTKVLSGHLMSGRIKSCGCSHVECGKRMGIKNTTHGMRKTKASKVYSAWRSMKQRCSNQKNAFYKNYGGRGIKICERWKVSFENFFSDMGNPPSNDYSLDRIDVNGDYTPSNCRWATNEQQQNNKSNNVSIKFRGVEKTLAEWADSTGISYSALWHRVNKGWPIEEIFSVPVSKNNTHYRSDR
jgi:hypothetical protein